MCVYISCVNKGTTEESEWENWNWRRTGKNKVLDPQIVAVKSFPSDRQESFLNPRSSEGTLFCSPGCSPGSWSHRLQYLGPWTSSIKNHESTRQTSGKSHLSSKSLLSSTSGGENTATSDWTLGFPWTLKYYPQLLPQLQKSIRTHSKSAGKPASPESSCLFWSVSMPLKLPSLTAHSTQLSSIQPCFRFYLFA